LNDAVANFTSISHFLKSVSIVKYWAHFVFYSEYLRV